jgi:small-conductance mechanosensitive channel
LEFSPTRLVLILGVAIAAHVVVIGVRALSHRVLRSRVASETKVHTVTSFGSSLLVFGIYFGSVGFALSELGVSLTTYLASASVIGLAVSFGSQGLVQDVITGLTVVFSDLLDVGDMVDLGGQVGIVESVGMRFTVLVNFSGARVFVPNRSIANVINYPRGFIRAYIDARLPADPSMRDAAKRRLEDLAQAAYEEYPGILLLPPTLEGPFETRGGYSYLRIKFRIWPGQGALLETAVKATVTQSLQQLDEHYGDWMVTIHYRAESRSLNAMEHLPRPAALGMRDPGAREGGAQARSLD